MATYKVIQDIEAEDKLLGPLTLRQFIYAGIVVVLGFACFELTVHGAMFLTIPFLPIMGFFGLLAAPFGHEQPNEVWLLAKVRFAIKPRKRIWDQSGIKELVTITVPKKVEHVLTDGLTQSEVKSRLQALANTIDSRGWAVKNVNAPVMVQSSDDRLIDVGSLPQEVPNYDTYASDDMLDEMNNPTAQQLGLMINKSEQAHRQAIMQTVQNGGQPAPVQQPNDYWFMNTPPAAPGMAAFTAAPTITPGSQPVATNPTPDTGAEEAALLEKLHQEQAKPKEEFSHMRTINPTPVAPPPPLPAAPTTASQPEPTPSAPKPEPPANPAILQLANNDDLNISTLAREANKATQGEDGEVVISLH